MADITMCKGFGCDLKDVCYRHTAKACEYRQSYFVESPIRDGDCDFFWGKTQESIMNQLKDIVK